jgi:hypothetical protein
MVIIFISIIITCFALLLREYTTETDVCNKVLNNWAFWKTERYQNSKEWILEFNESGVFNWSQFDQYVKDQLGESLANDHNLLVLERTQSLVIELRGDITVEIDLQSNGRFIHNLGALCVIKGSNGNASLIIKNGQAFDQGPTLGGGINHENGSMDLLGIDVYIQDCVAESGGGAYFANGFIQLVDNEDKPSRLMVQRCRALVQAGGGIYILRARFSILSDNGIVECLECFTSQSAGGLILLYGELSLLGNHSQLIARRCNAGVGPDNVLSHAAGIQFGSEYILDVTEDDVENIVKLKGKYATIIADECQGPTATGIYLKRTSLCLASPMATLQANNNVIVTNDPINYEHQVCAIEIDRCTIRSQWPLTVHVDNNVFVTLKPHADVFIRNSLERIFPVNLTGNGAIVEYN